jgi:Mor family transcriptional regulator
MQRKQQDTKQVSVCDKNLPGRKDRRLVEIAAQTMAMFVQENVDAIVQAIGVRYSAEFGGEQLHIDADSAERTALRNVMIYGDFAAGMSTRAVAKKWNISKSQAARLYQRFCSGAVPPAPTFTGAKQP